MNPTHRTIAIQRDHPNMHARQLAVLAHWTAFHSTVLSHGRDEIDALVASHYWAASKARAQRWMRALNMFENDLQAEDPGHNPWPAIEIVVHEILVAELLTRVWGAAMLALDRRAGTDEMKLIVQSVQLAQTEARNRAMRLILAARGKDETAYDRMNGLRIKVERWTDFLLGQMPDVAITVRFAFDAARVRDFAIEQHHSSNEVRRRSQSIFLASFAADLKRHMTPFPANPALNAQIASGVMACFPADRFDSAGLPKSLRQMWIEKSGTDSQMLVDYLSDLDRPPTNSATGPLTSRH